MNRKYVTAFPGVRDQYKLVESLSQAKSLGAFITDVYFKGFSICLARLTGNENKLKKRFIANTKKDLVFQKPAYKLHTRFWSLFFPKSKVYVWEDILFAKAAVRKAKNLKCNLILYEFQSGYAFKQHFDHPIKKILFQFHPHPAWEHPILLEEAKRFPQFLDEVLENTRTMLGPNYRYHTYDSFTHADIVLVASNLTKVSLVYAGCASNKIHVIPYGFNPNDTKAQSHHSLVNRPYFLYVGSGSFRKGLHTLLLAWQSANLSEKYSLVVISRVVDKSLEPMLDLQGVTWIAGVSQANLNWFYQHALAFVMPSFSEGFGQVYLEALSNGCPVIGTANSVLPDIIGGEPHIKLIEPGDANALINKLKWVASLKTEDDFFNKQMIKDLVVPFTWERFSKLIQIAIQE